LCVFSRRFSRTDHCHAPHHAALGLAALVAPDYGRPVARTHPLLGDRPAQIGATGAASVSVPDLLITDGEHLAIVRPDGVPVLRARSGDFQAA
jgi:hypothetical protein